MKKKIITGTITGALLGVVCIIGASIRNPEGLSTAYLFSFWFNRVILGLFIALLPSVCETTAQKYIRSVLAGLLISFMFYSATGFSDLIGFLAGGLYGFIIEFVLSKVSGVETCAVESN
jgi:uncharacterized membrane protein